jgi:hypothetical protein
VKACRRGSISAAIHRLDRGWGKPEVNIEFRMLLEKRTAEMTEAELVVLEGSIAVLTANAAPVIKYREAGDENYHLVSNQLAFLTRLSVIRASGRAQAVHRAVLATSWQRRCRFCDPSAGSRAGLDRQPGGGRIYPKDNSVRVRPRKPIQWRFICDRQPGGGRIHPKDDSVRVRPRKQIQWRFICVNLVRSD